MMASSHPKELSETLYCLCSKVTGLDRDAVLPLYSYARKILGSRDIGGCRKIADEYHIMEHLKKALVHGGREKDAAHLSELHRKLQSQVLLKNRASVLSLLSQLSNVDSKSGKGKLSSTAFFKESLPQHRVSTPYTGREREAHLAGGGAREGVSSVGRGEHASASALSISSVSSAHTGGSSGFSSIRGREIGSGDHHRTVPQAFLP
ncbi:hypothetical protein EGW08_010420, partial [Elysia chlorotica]